jgi:signal transduction histidine kinase
VLSFLWFCCNVAQVLFATVSRPSPSVLAVGELFLAFAFPPIVMQLTRAEVAQSDEARIAAGWRAVLWPAYAAAIVMPLWGLSLKLSQQGPGADAFADRLFGFGLSGTFMIAALYCIAILSRYHDGREARGRQSRRSLLALFGVMAALFAGLLALTSYDRTGSTAWGLGRLILIAAKSLPLVFMFVGTYYENRFQFFDLFMKRGTAMIATLALLTASLAIMLPALQPLAGTWVAPWIYAIVLLPIVTTLPWIHGRLGTWLDRRWLGRRFATVEAVKHFLGSLRSATTEPQLVASAQAGLEEIFAAKAIVVVGPGSPPTEMPIAQEIPIRAGDRIVGRFLMGRRLSEAPYFSQDVALLMSLADVFSHVLENLHLQERKLEQERRTRELSLHASRSELKALRAQINPHFLFNALNSIAGLIHRDPAVADRTIEQLADVFRYALRGAESEWAVLDDELDFVRAYLDVERARFGDRLRTDVRLETGVRGARLPTMIVQTLVENAVKHGAASVRGPASVVVIARQEAGRLVVSVADNGPGFREEDPPATRTRGGYGLVNVRQRLEGYFGSAAALTVDRDDVHRTTTVSVSLPLLRQEPRAPAPGGELRP